MVGSAEGEWGGKKEVIIQFLCIYAPFTLYFLPVSPRYSSPQHGNNKHNNFAGEFF